MSPEEHTTAIRALQTDLSEIKGILNNGLRTMVQDQKSELVCCQGGHPVHPRRAHRPRRKEDVIIYEISGG
jgi:hypothetical protein